MLDTNICIYVIRKKPREVYEALLTHPVIDVCVSSVTVAELEFGVQKGSQVERNREALSHFLGPLAVLDFDFPAALVYGRIRAELEARGTGIGSLDTLIAAHALSAGLTLVTNNIKEFARVPELVLEDWTANA